MGDRSAAKLGQQFDGAALDLAVVARGPDPAGIERELARGALRFELRRKPDMIMDVFAQGMPDGGFVMSFTDVTAERAAIEALSRANETLEARVMERTLELADALTDAERANASRARFVAAASHDLLQPLSAAKLFIGSIAAEALEPFAREAVQKAQNALDSVEGILGALLDISKLESGRLAVSPVPVPGATSRVEEKRGQAILAYGRIRERCSVPYPHKLCVAGGNVGL